VGAEPTSSGEAPEARGATLVIFIDGAFTRPENGSHVRFLDLVTFAADRFASVTLYSFKDHPTYPWTDTAVAEFAARFPGVNLIVEPRGRAVRLLTKVKNAVIALFPSLARHVLRWKAPGATPAYERLLQSPGGVVLVLNFVDAASILNGLPGGGFVIETHDVKFLKHSKRFKQPTNTLRVLAKYRSEIAIWRLASALVAISPVDATLMQTLADDTRVFYVPSYGRAAPAPAPLEPEGGFDFDLLFVGADNELNAMGLARFIEANAGWLERRRMAVAGHVCDNPMVASVLAHRPHCVSFGFQDDLAPLYARSKAALSPVDGTGLKIKVVDALAHGKPVFGSAHALAGLPPGFEECVFPARQQEMDALLDDAERLRRSEKAALAYYQKFQQSGNLVLFEAFLQRQLSGHEPLGLRRRW